MADAALDQLLKTNAGLASDFFSRGRAAEEGINSLSKINVPLPKVPKLAALPKPPSQPKSDALEGFTGLAPLLSVLGGFLTRRPLVASLNALAASNNAFHAGQQEGYIRNLQAFRDNLDVIAAQNRQDLESYNAALNNAQLTQAQKVAEIQTLASERRDDFMMAQDNLKSMATAIAAKENIASRMEAARLAADSRIKAAEISSQKPTTATMQADLIAQKEKELGRPMTADEKAAFVAKFKDPYASLLAPTGATSGTPAPDVHGEAYLKTINPQVQPVVKALAEGRMPFPSGFSLRSPYWQHLLEAVSKYDPSFDSVNNNARYRTRQDFTSGQAARNVTSLNTVMGHILTLKKAGEALHNTNIPLANSIINQIRSATGDERVVDFETASQAVSDELERSFRGVGGALTSIEQWRKRISPSASPAQQQGAWNTLVDLLDSRIENLGDQYSRGMGVTTDGLTLLSPKAQNAYEQIRGKSPILSRIGETGKKTMLNPTYSLGQIITGTSGRKYKVIGGTPEDPELEEIKQ